MAPTDPLSREAYSLHGGRLQKCAVPWAKMLPRTNFGRREAVPKVAWLDRSRLWYGACLEAAIVEAVCLSAWGSVGATGPVGHSGAAGVTT